MSGLTCKEAVSQFFTGDSFYPTEGNDRLWGHDFIHTLLGAKLGTGRAEELAGIYQAVLLNDPSVNKLHRAWKNGRTPLTPEAIKKEVMPGLRKFTAELAARERKKSLPALKEPEIEEHYVKAKVLSRLIYEHYGRDLGDIPVEEIKATPFDRYESLLIQAEAIYDGRYEMFAKTRTKLRLPTAPTVIRY